MAVGQAEFEAALAKALAAGHVVAQSIRAQDAVTAQNLNPDLDYAFYYEDGQFANEAAVRARCPHAILKPITVQGTSSGHAPPRQLSAMADTEPGCMTMAQTDAWLANELAAGAYLPAAYADQNHWLNLGFLQLLAKYGDRILRGVANFDGIPEIPDWADGKQYATGSVDQWICRPRFFAAKPAPATGPTGTARVEMAVDLATMKVTAVHGLPGHDVKWGDTELYEALKDVPELCTGGDHRGQWRRG